MQTALNMETKMLSIDLKKRGIMVVGLCPGMVRTDLKGLLLPVFGSETGRTLQVSTVDRLVKVCRLSSKQSINYRDNTRACS